MFFFGFGERLINILYGRISFFRSFAQSKDAAVQETLRRIRVLLRSKFFCAGCNSFAIRF